MRLSAILLIITISSVAALGQGPANVIFLEPLGKIDTNRAEVRRENPLYRRVVDPAKYLPWLRNESAQRALRLYGTGYEIANPNGGTPDYYVALVPDGNHASVGFRLQTGDKVEEHAKQAYMLLDPSPDAFESTLLHETGHVVMAMLAGGRQLDGNDVTAIPHTTAALSDRGTAFSEGYAIHLEALAAHLNHDLRTRQQFHRQEVKFEDAAFKESEYFHQSSDLATFAQTVARYLEVRENSYAFEPAFQGPDYLRVQMEKARDFAGLRNANQLLQSEGFYASVFFLWVVRGTTIPKEQEIWERERRLLVAMKAMFAEDHWEPSSPWLVRLVLSYIKQFPDEKATLAEAVNDLSHGVFVDPDAARIWKSHYLAALNLDKKGMDIAGITERRKQWKDAVVKDPQVLFSQVGIEIPCKLPGTKVSLAAFGEDSPVIFDLNTAPAGILRLVPGIGESEVSKWTEQRAKKPFASIEDFTARAGLRAAVFSALQF